MLSLTTMLPNPPLTRSCKPEFSTDRYPPMRSNRCGGITYRFTNICGITRFTLIFMNSITQQRTRNVVFVLEKATDGQPIFKNNSKF